eukprot:scaffold26116_cov74-Phaeocystis_antarctica.AAC.3
MTGAIHSIVKRWPREVAPRWACPSDRVGGAAVERRYRAGNNTRNETARVATLSPQRTLSFAGCTPRA